MFFCTCIGKASTPQNIPKGIKTTGIWLFNENMDLLMLISHDTQNEVDLEKEVLAFERHISSERYCILTVKPYMYFRRPRKSLTLENFGKTLQKKVEGEKRKNDYSNRRPK